MNREVLLRRMRKPSEVNQALYSRFGSVCLDSQAMLMAVHDFESFRNLWRTVRNPSARKDRMEKLYRLYLAVSKVSSAFSIEQFRYLKTTVPGYERVSMAFFLDDIAELISAGVLIVDTPTINELKMQQQLDLLRSHVAKSALKNSN